jgi:hypothetical protein
MSRLTYLLPLLVVLGVIWATATASRTPVREAPAVAAAPPADLAPTVQAVNGALQTLWEQAGLAAADKADELTVFRRLSLALHGTVPSLEEIRLFEADGAPERLERWTAAMLEDPRFFDYFAERLARSYVGVEKGQFIVFRRDRLLEWLAKQLREHAPYDQTVRQMVGATGVWTGEGQVNFITGGFADGNFDANKLAARSARAFLGQRIDCAQCHNHPFDHWKQSEFEGIAAYYGQVELSPLGGLIDKRGKQFKIKDRQTLDDRVVAPAVPFHPEWCGSGGSQREQLGRWLTHPDNQQFEIATANRVWGLMFGRPFEIHRPVDDLPDPGTQEKLQTLTILGRDFREHGYDLRRLIQVIAASAPFRLQSRHPLDLESAPDASQSEGDIPLSLAHETWAVFPLVRLRPEQVIGAMLQANGVRTVDQNSHLFTRFRKMLRNREFVEEFGDPGVDELQDFSGTIPQALLRMNGNFAKELTDANPLTAPGRISMDAATPEKGIETIYLTCLTRRPSAEEQQYFRDWFQNKRQRGRASEDLYWTLFNSPEFSWNH